MAAVSSRTSPGGLDPARIAREKRVEGTHTADAWLACLGPLAEGDRRTDALRLAAGLIALVAATIAVIGFVARGPGIIVGIVCAVVAATAFGSRLALRRRDMPDALRRFVVPLLLVLREELGRHEPVTLRVDLVGAQQPRKRLGERRWNAHGRHVTERRYADPWLSGETRLVDGTRLSWEIVDHVRQRDQSRRNPRGKLKSKTKLKVKRYLTVRLGLPHDIYETRHAPPGGRRERLAVRPGERRDVVRVRRVIEARTLQEPPALEQFLDLIGQAYQRAVPTRGAGR